MKVGELELSGRAILAPMAEVTDAPFRTICKENGAGLTFTQMVSAEGVFKNSFGTLKYLSFSKNEKPIGVQLLGNNPDYIFKAIKDLKELKPDIIDLNCGCSVTKVCQNNMGASLLDHPDKIRLLAGRMKEAAGGIPVSIKMRAGRSRQKINIEDNAKAAEDGGASMIIVHGRVRADEYSDAPDWSWIKRAKQAVSIPVVGNGSLFEPSDCIKMMDETGCDAVLIARGALGNPFIFSRLNSILTSGKDIEIGAEEIHKTALKHFRMMIDDVGEERGIKNARKHLAWYYKYQDGIFKFIEKIYSLENKELVEEYLAEHTENIINGVYPKEDFERIRKSFNERVLFWMN
ncbi:MAG TPA: tRNA dihydrouridine synthase DusB [Ignavibacteriales bacterium]|nr:tRNA dihydrouridine synthase DusB [Ignavibacteriales bacterium]